LVRKAGTDNFMQAGGKIEPTEDARTALRRELEEEIGLQVDGVEPRYLGRFSAPAANEAGYTVVAELFHIRTTHEPIISAEIAEALWVGSGDAVQMQLAPLTRNCVLPLALCL
jgi:8-oxo-dGTP diphosphatase